MAENPKSATHEFLAPSVGSASVLHPATSVALSGPAAATSTGGALVASAPSTGRNSTPRLPEFMPSPNTPGTLHEARSPSLIALDHGWSSCSEPVSLSASALQRMDVMIASLTKDVGPAQPPSATSVDHSVI